MFAVIYCALENEGESLSQGAHAHLATFMGGSLSLVFMALFSEHRWAFGTAVASWIALCAYMMQDNRRYYFWFVGGWLTILMPIYSSENSAFNRDRDVAAGGNHSWGIGLYPCCQRPPHRSSTA